MKYTNNEIKLLKQMINAKCKNPNGMKRFMPPIYYRMANGKLEEYLMGFYKKFNREGPKLKAHFYITANMLLCESLRFIPLFTNSGGIYNVIFRWRLAIGR